MIDWLIYEKALTGVNAFFVDIKVWLVADSL